MEIPVWVAELAAEFWSKAGGGESFPRELRRPIAVALHLGVAYLPKLSIGLALRWLEDNGIVCTLGSDNRPLKACLIARFGHGLVLIDGSDSDAEQRYSLAHELAHFLHDYLYPRRQVAKRLGPASLEVLDGVRPPTLDERIHAALRNASTGFHVHLMDRNLKQKPANCAIAQAECDADRLAYELLAPAEQILNSCRSGEGACDFQIVEDSLQAVYGLPPQQAQDYARILLPNDDFVDPFLLRLKNC